MAPRKEKKFPGENFCENSGYSADFVTEINLNPLVFDTDELLHYAEKEREHQYFYNYFANNNSHRDCPFFIVDDPYGTHLSSLVELGFFCVVTPIDPFNLAKRLKARGVIFCNPEHQIPAYYNLVNTVILGGVTQNGHPQISLDDPQKEIQLLKSILNDHSFLRNQIWAMRKSA